MSWSHRRYVVTIVWEAARKAKVECRRTLISVVWRGVLERLRWEGTRGRNRGVRLECIGTREVVRRRIFGRLNRIQAQECLYVEFPELGQRATVI